MPRVGGSLLFEAHVKRDPDTEANCPGLDLRRLLHRCDHSNESKLRKNGDRQV